MPIFQRALDIILSFLGLFFMLPVIIIIFLLLTFDEGSPIFLQRRVGLKKKEFSLIKFRTMRLGTESVATHLVDGSRVTKIGRFLRAVKLDELPQIINVIVGDMSLVGPRPCLPNQTVLVRERDVRGVFNVRPGITGLAQIQGVDMSQPEVLAEIDKRMIDEMTFALYLRIIFGTILGRGSGDKVKG